MRFQLRSAKPPTLEEAINIATELELIRDLERTEIKTESKVMGVSGRPVAEKSQMGVLLGVVEGLRQEMKNLQATVSGMKNSQANTRQNLTQGNHPTLRSGQLNSPRTDFMQNRNSGERGEGCWECGCNRHICHLKNCPYLN